MAHGIVFSRDQDYEPCDFTEEAGYRAIGRLLWRSPDLTAVLALGDVIAFGAIRAIYDRGGSVPGTLSIMGFDGTALSRYSVPRITTVRQDTDASQTAAWTCSSKACRARASPARACPLRHPRAGERGRTQHQRRRGPSRRRPRYTPAAPLREGSRPHEKSRNPHAHHRASLAVGRGHHGCRSALVYRFPRRGRRIGLAGSTIVPTSYGDSPYQSFSTYAAIPTSSTSTTSPPKAFSIARSTPAAPGAPRPTA